MRIHLCNPIGTSLGSPEYEIPRLSGFLQSKKIPVKVTDLKIRVIAKLKNLLSSSGEGKFIQTSRLFERYRLEEKTGAIQNCLLLLAQLKCPELFNGISITENVISRAKLLKIEKIIDKEINSWIKEVTRGNFELVGFSSTSVKIFELLEAKNNYFRNHLELEFAWSFVLARMLKKEVKATIWIGCNYSRLDVFNMIKEKFEQDNSIDFIIFEDYEETLLEYIEKRRNNADLSAIPGTIVKRKGKVICNPSRGLINPLDKLPFPDYSGIPWGLYKRVFGRKTLQIQGSIGCSERCSFCSLSDWREEYIKKSAGYLALEMMSLKKKYDIDFFSFDDRLININIGELEELCELLIAIGLDFRWSGYVKISPLMTKKLLKKMYLAGCRIVFYGLESGSPKILKKMNKRFTLRVASRVLRDTVRCRITTVVQILTDFPGENEKELSETVDFVKENLPFITQLRVNSYSSSKSSNIFRGRNISKFIQRITEIEKENVK